MDKINCIFRRLQELQKENDNILGRFESLHASCDTSKHDIVKLTETISKFEKEKFEGAAKLICLNTENESLKKELQDLKVISISHKKPHVA